MLPTASPHSPQSSRVIKATPFFYGWVILAAGTLGIIMIGPSQTFTVSIFLDHFISELGIPRSTLALIYGAATLGASFMLPVAGRLLDRIGARRMALVSAFGLGLAGISLSQVQGVFTIFLGFLALRFLGFGALQLASNNLIAQWFIRRRGVVMGLAGLSLAAGLLIFPPLAEALIAAVAWRWAWVLLGVLVWVIMLPVSWFLFRDKPELYGLRPDGDPQPPPAVAGIATPPSLISEENWTLAEARRSGAFWLFLIALSTIAGIIGGLVFHQLSLFEVRGLSRELAVTGFQISAFSTAAGNLMMGRLLDRFSARRMLALTLTILVAGLALVQVMHTPAQAYLYSILLGLIAGAFRVIDSVIWPKYFGRRHLGSIRGMTMLGTLGGTAFGPYPLGLSLDYFGNYAYALNPLILFAILIGLSTIFINRPEKQ